MSDLISRQAAIDAVGSMLRRKFGIGGDLAEITLAGLPSAQPERKKGNEKCSNELPCGWCSLFDTPCFGRGGEQDGH